MKMAGVSCGTPLPFFISENPLSLRQKLPKFPAKHQRRSAVMTRWIKPFEVSTHERLVFFHEFVNGAHDFKIPLRIIDQRNGRSRQMLQHFLKNFQIIQGVLVGKLKTQI